LWDLSREFCQTFFDLFAPTTIPVDPLQSQPQHYNLDGSDKIRMSFDMQDIDTRLQKVNSLLDSLSTAAD